MRHCHGTNCVIKQKLLESTAVIAQNKTVIRMLVGILIENRREKDFVPFFHRHAGQGQIRGQMPFMARESTPVRVLAALRWSAVSA